MRYALFVAGPVLTLAPNLASLAIEVAAEGWVSREVGLDATGVVSHRTPSEAYPRGEYGLLLDVPRMHIDDDIRCGNARELSESEFEAFWDLPDHPPPDAPHGRILLQRLLDRWRHSEAP